MCSSAPALSEDGVALVPAHFDDVDQRSVEVQLVPAQQVVVGDRADVGGSAGHSLWDRHRLAQKGKGPSGVGRPDP